MTFFEKIQCLETYLNLSKDNYADSFKQDIIIYFEDDFIEENKSLGFLKNLKTKRRNSIKSNHSFMTI